MPPEPGGIFGRLTYDLPLAYFQGWGRRGEGASAGTQGADPGRDDPTQAAGYGAHPLLTSLTFDPTTYD